MEVKKLVNSPNYSVSVSSNTYAVKLVSPQPIPTVRVGQKVNWVWEVTDNGTPMSGVTVTMYTNGAFYSTTVGTGVTDSSGKATIPYAFGTAGTDGFHASANP
jgi:hypothetical protein